MVFDKYVWKNISQEFKLKNIEEIKSYFIKEIYQNELMSSKHEKVGTTLNYIEHSLLLLLWLRDVVTFNFYFCFFSSYSYKNYELYTKIRNFCNNCRN